MITIVITIIMLFSRETRTSQTANMEGFASVQDDFSAVSDGKTNKDVHSLLCRLKIFAKKIERKKLSL